MTRLHHASLLPVVAALGCVYVIWGSTYFAIRVAIDTLPPLLMAGARFLIAGLLLCLVVEGRAARPRARITFAHWRAAAITGLLLLGVGNGGVTLGEERVPSGIAALLVATVPLWMAIFDRVFFGQRVRWQAMAGVAVGLGGVALLLRPTGHASTLDEAIVLLSPLAWAAGSLYARSAPQPARQLTAAGMEMVCGGALLIVAAGLHGEWAEVHPQSISAASLLAFGYLVVFGSLLAYSCYVWLLHVIPTRILATYAYVNPLVAVALGSAFLSEPITAATVVAGGLIVVAVALILAFRAPESAAEEVSPGGLPPIRNPD